MLLLWLEFLFLLAGWLSPADFVQELPVGEVKKEASWYAELLPSVFAEESSWRSERRLQIYTVISDGWFANTTATQPDGSATNDGSYNWLKRHKKHHLDGSEAPAATEWEKFCSRCLNAVFFLVVAAFVSTRLEPPMQDITIPEGRDWESSLWECTKDPGMCCLGFWCYFVLWARTEHDAATMDFWWALARNLVIYLFAFYDMHFFILAALGIWFRYQLRDKSRMERQPCLDGLSVCLCPELSMCQQARHIQAARARGAQHPVPMVGMPVTLSPHIGGATSPSAAPATYDPPVRNNARAVSPGQNPSRLVSPQAGGQSVGNRADAGNSPSNATGPFL